MARLDTVVFDLGNVLIDWDPRHLFRKLFPSREADMEEFLATVCTMEWHVKQDAGGSWQEAVQSLQTEHPEEAHLIAAFYERWPEMLAGPIEGTVEILGELKGRGVPLYALTNWSHELFPLTRGQFPFLEWFRGIVVSGEEKMVKPDRRIFERLTERYRLQPARTVFIDDSLRNVEAAAASGFAAIRFISPEQLRTDLQKLGLL